MGAQEKLRVHREQIIGQWVKVLLDSYPAEGGKFFGRKTNEFSNPVGATFKKNIAALFDFLTEEDDIEKGRSTVDGIVRIRAVQGFSASQAVAPLFAIRGIIRSCLGEDTGAFEGQLERRLEKLVLLAFDQYMACREILWQQKANSLYNRTHRLLEKHKLLRETDDEGV